MCCTRRAFPLRSAAALAGGGSLTLDRAIAANGRHCGIDPIVQTPYTYDDRADFKTLTNEVQFLDRTGVHGIVWPQCASAYQYLTFEERIEGADRIRGADQRRMDEQARAAIRLTYEHVKPSFTAEA